VRRESLYRLGERAAWRLPAHARAAVLWRIGRARGELAYAVVEALVEPGAAVVDVGANWGRFTARMARLVGRDGRVHSFEPSPAQRERLEQIARGRPQVKLHGIGLSDHLRHAALRSDDSPGSAHGRVSLDGGQEAIVLARLDETIPPGDAISFIKCDVEGHELPALRGAAGTLERWKPAILVEIEVRHGGSVEDTAALLEPLGYRGWALTDGGLLPLERFDVERDQLARLPADPAVPVPHDYVNDFLFLAGDRRPPSVLPLAG
jgi:FkbM family methyltransferase